jgi:hypothetical protein
MVESLPGLSFERTTSPCYNPRAAGPGSGRIPQAGRSTTSRPDSLGVPGRSVAIANPQVARFLSSETRPDKFQSMSFHMAIQSLRCGVRRRHLDRAPIETNLFAVLQNVGTGHVRGVGNSLALRLALLWQNLAIDWRNRIPESGFQ